MSDLAEIVLSTLADLEDQAWMEFASHRTSADQVEHAVRNILMKSDGRFKPPKSARTAADVLFEDEITHHINIKSMDVSKEFHMPNLVGADSLRRILDRGEKFYLLRIHHHSGEIIKKEFWNIEDINWSCLQLGALGAGQIQMRNGLAPLQCHEGGSDLWRQQWKDKMISHYQHEIEKCNKRIKKWQ